MTYDDAKNTTLSVIPRDQWGNYILDNQLLEHFGQCMHSAGVNEGMKRALLTVTNDKPKQVTR